MRRFPKKPSKAYVAKLEHEIVTSALPSILLPLAKRGLLTEENSRDPKAVAACLRRNLKYAIKRMQMGVALENTFSKQAIEQWKKGERTIGIVLLATAIEQWLNFVLRVLAEAKGFSDDIGTQLVKKHNFDAKLTWLFEMLGSAKLSAKYVRKVKVITELRNSIVHYKAQSAHPDTDKDSYSVIVKELNRLKWFQIETLFVGLQRETWAVALKNYPALGIAMQACETLLETRDRKASTAATRVAATKGQT